MDWQLIETAPKRTVIILYRPGRIGVGGRVCVGQYDFDEWSRRGPRPFWRSDWGGLGVQYDRDTPPTHWMPLPEPPATGRHEEEG